MNNIPTVTISEMREVDRIMVEDFGIPIVMMMENAGRAIAVLSRQILRGSVKNKKISIMCGHGNNGGDGLAAARHLTNWGADVKIILASSVDQLKTDPKQQYQILQKMRAEIKEVESPSGDVVAHLTKQIVDKSDLIIDALLGYNLSGDPREPFATLINLANQSKKNILAVDIPSGLNGDTGTPANPTIIASSTITLALPKIGLVSAGAQRYVGNLYVSDLSVPMAVYRKIGVEASALFCESEIIEV